MKLTKLSVVALVMGALALTVLPGCETLTESPGQNRNRVARTIDTNGKQIPEDFERAMLLDTPSAMTPTPMPNY